MLTISLPKPSVSFMGSYMIHGKLQGCNIYPQNQLLILNFASRSRSALALCVSAWYDAEASPDSEGPAEVDAKLDEMLAFFLDSWDFALLAGCIHVGIDPEDTKAILTWLRKNKDRTIKPYLADGKVNRSP